MTPKEHATLSETLGCEHLLLTGRGTTALWALLRALLPSGSRVLVPVNVCEVVVVAILEAGMIPQYVDIDPIQGDFTTDELNRAYCDGCKGLIAVHGFGAPLPMTRIGSWASRNDVVVIEDCCNALGATLDGRPVGTWSAASIYSFGHGKTLDVGFGGILASRDASLVTECARMIDPLPAWSQESADHDRSYQALLRTIRRDRRLQEPHLYQAIYRGYRPALLASAPPELASMIAGALRHLAENLDVRAERAKRYRQALVHQRITHRRATPGESCWRYTFHLPADIRDQVVRHVRTHDLPISTWYPAVDRFFHKRSVGTTMAGGDQFEQTVVNLFVEPSVENKTIEACALEIVAGIELALPQAELCMA
ncbi:MAG: DegT/DnrJ/EryC1/StrS family aminotransferase [Planctomycetes bacterium]|nr:DegT/DnrJ/EryC1/StrS family aminotransferase [Planctomycetota bacterium]